MIKTDGQSRLFCTHSIPSDLACPQCEKQEKDYQNRPLYASLTASNSRLHQSPARSFNTFYVPMTDKVNRARTFINDDCVNIESNQGVMRVPRSKVEACDEGNVQARTTFPGDFQNHAHRFTRSFSWKTKPEESPFAQMQPLPKLVKKPGYGEICFKSRMDRLHVRSSMFLKIFVGQRISSVSAAVEIQRKVVANGRNRLVNMIILMRVGPRVLSVRMMPFEFSTLQLSITRKSSIRNCCYR